MGIFDFFSGSEGGFMDVIRCDEQDYLVHKWSPAGTPDSSAKENAIRYGSRLRVKPGESAVFFYNQGNGELLDIVEGPLDKTISTDNFPVLASIVGAAFGGASPFMAEIYFFHSQKNLQSGLGFLTLMFLITVSLIWEFPARFVVRLPSISQTSGTL